jgi:D-amino peptidase
MKVLISVDIEGVTGMASWDEATRAHPDYSLFRDRMQLEAAAVCEGVQAAGADEVLVRDAHSTARNLDGEKFPKGVQVLSGWARHPLSMVQGLNGSFDAVLFVGYHARAGSEGNPLSHTMSSSSVAEILLNGEPLSEFRLHALAAATFGVPSVFLSGDQAICKEAKAFLEGIRVVPTKEGFGASVLSRHPLEVREDLRRESEEALREGTLACLPSLPDSFRMEVVYHRHQEAQNNGFYPGAERLGARRVGFAAEDYFEILRFIHFCV